MKYQQTPNKNERWINIRLKNKNNKRLFYIDTYSKQSTVHAVLQIKIWHSNIY